MVQLIDRCKVLQYVKDQKIQRDKQVLVFEQ